MADYEYDVAFSFHQKDEGLAQQLNDLLQDRFKTFIYSERQNVLAGRDGEQAFAEVYAKKARVVVVFSRKEWGETPFTRIEQTAIRGRAFDEGYDFTLFIPTDEPPAVPVWLPRTQLWFGIKRFGLEGAAAVVEQKIQALGGEVTAEHMLDTKADPSFQGIVARLAWLAALANRGFSRDAEKDAMLADTLQFDFDTLRQRFDPSIAPPSPQPAPAGPRTNAEKRAAVLSMLDAEPSLSDREIARRLGISPQTVNNWRKRHRGAAPAGAPA